MNCVRYDEIKKFCCLVLCCIVFYSIFYGAASYCIQPVELAIGGLNVSSYFLTPIDPSDIGCVCLCLCV